MAIKSTILVVEDEEPLRELLRFNLRQEGYRVLAAGSAERGLALLRADDADLIVLDVGLPGMDGLEMCRQVRRRRETPILFLTAKKDEADKVLGLKLGGDDYVTKPFSLRELLARIEALDRRARGGAGRGGRLLEAGGIRLDPDQREMTVRGRPASLSLKEFELMRLLLEASPRIVSRATLLKRIWGYARSMAVQTRTVDQHVALLRRKLGPERGLIETVPKGGYRIRRGKKAAGGRR